MSIFRTRHKPLHTTSFLIVLCTVFAVFGLMCRDASAHQNITVDFQRLRVGQERGRVVVAGDCAYSYANLTGLDGNGVYIPLGFGVGSHYQSLMVLDRMMAEVDGDLSRIIVLHDFERWERFRVVSEEQGFRIART